jgi:hypothetical protein
MFELNRQLNNERVIIELALNRVVSIANEPEEGTFQYEDGLTQENDDDETSAD